MEVEPDPAIVVTPEHILTTKEILIQRQDTHLDSLAERLRELRVRRVIEPMLAGRSLSDVPQDDIRFLVDLGTFRFDGAGGLVIANPIYREALPPRARQHDHGQACRDAGRAHDHAHPRLDATLPCRQVMLVVRRLCCGWRLLRPDS